VDKVLVGLAAVQTLSRLNRIHAEKNDTFVLDFRNDAEDITEAFKPWYEATVALPTDPNLLHDLADRLLGLQLVDQVEAFSVAAVLADQSKRVDQHGRVYALLAPVVERFRGRRPEDQEEVRGLLDQYVRTYSFLSQVVDFGSASLEALYLTSRALLALIPGEEGSGRLDLGAEVELTHLRLEKTTQGHITPERGFGEQRSIYEGKGREDEAEKERLSKIITVLNERFGTQLTLADQLLFDQFEASWLGDEQLTEQARANTLENFRLVFADAFMKTIIQRMDSNSEIFRRILDDRDLQAEIQNHYLQRVFRDARQVTPPAPRVVG
jgi:type I restriction enzyme R subunit